MYSSRAAGAAGFAASTSPASSLVGDPGARRRCTVRSRGREERGEREREWGAHHGGGRSVGRTWRGLEGGGGEEEEEEEGEGENEGEGRGMDGWMDRRTGCQDEGLEEDHGMSW
ncbi:hypothetical protein V494_02180 [Pseudogymnoascus sp. VKM F-4513 (FW-928)]|nr:hypothetical protein V494_02180 [Pseudogymnoascus sp. VKM F-4513 (FW-928)]